MRPQKPAPPVAVRRRWVARMVGLDPEYLSDYNECEKQRRVLEWDGLSRVHPPTKYRYFKCLASSLVHVIKFINS